MASALKVGPGGGGVIERLEDAFARRTGAAHALAVSSGTAALHVALAACGVGPGDEVILSTYDWGAAAAATLALGAHPVFADVDPWTYTLDPVSVASRVSSRTAAVVATHLFGHPAALDRLAALAREARVALVEDCAQALGARYRARAVGSWGDMACFSLGRGKVLDCGEGGVVVTSRFDLYVRAVRFCQHPLRQIREGFQPIPFTLNYRIHPLAAALGVWQLPRLRRRLRQRRDAAGDLSTTLARLPGIVPVHVADDCTHTFHRYSPTYEPASWEGLPRRVVAQALQAEGVPLTEGFIPFLLHHRLTGVRRRRQPPNACPVAEERWGSTAMGLPVPPLASPARKRWLRAVEEAIGKVFEEHAALLALVAQDHADGSAAVLLDGGMTAQSLPAAVRLFPPG